MATTTERLARLTRYRTRYETVLIAPDGTRYLMAYTDQKSRRGLLDVIRDKTFLDGILTTIGVSRDAFADQSVLADKAADGGEYKGWQMRFSGRTQRECIISGENPWVSETTVNH